MALMFSNLPVGSENSEMNAFRPGQTPDMSTHSRLWDPRSQALGSMCILNLEARNPSPSFAQRCKGYRKGGLRCSHQAFPVCVKITSSSLCQFQNSWHINIPGAIWALIYSDRTLAMHIRSIRPCPFTYQDANQF